MLADGRFHEKAALQRAVREAAAERGVMLAFIILDNPAASLLDMQTVCDVFDVIVSIHANRKYILVNHLLVNSSLLCL